MARVKMVFQVELSVDKEAWATNYNLTEDQVVKDVEEYFTPDHIEGIVLRGWVPRESVDGDVTATFRMRTTEA